MGQREGVIILKDIYLVLFHDTRRLWMELMTVFSGTRYNHLTISLDPLLKDIYGFVGLDGGRVIRCGIKHFPDGDCMILRKEVTEDQFERLKEQMRIAWNEKYRYSYHRFGILFLALVMAPLYRMFRISLPRPLIRRIFNNPSKRTCGSFVGVLLDRAGIEFSPILGIPGTYNPYLMTCATFREPEIVGFDVVFKGRVEELAGKHAEIAAESGVAVCTQ